MLHDKMNMQRTEMRCSTCVTVKMLFLMLFLWNGLCCKHVAAIASDSQQLSTLISPTESSTSASTALLLSMDSSSKASGPVGSSSSLVVTSSNTIALASSSSVFPESSLQSSVVTSVWTVSSEAVSSYAMSNFTAATNSTVQPSYSLRSSEFSLNTTALNISTPVSTFMLNSTSYLPSTANFSLTTSFIVLNSSIISVLNSSAAVSPTPSSHSVFPISSHVFKNASEMKPARRDCNVVLLGLSEAMANMSRCAILNLRPMHVCENCSGTMQGIMNYHKAAFKDCGKELIREYNDQYQLIPKMYDFATSTWVSLDCNKCYNHRSASTDPWVLSDEFLRFKNLLDETMSCFHNHSNIVLPYSDITPWNYTVPSNLSASGEVCKSCEEPYSKLQKYFNSLNDETGISSQWCADIVYAINQTRFIWSKTYQCARLKKNIESVVALTCLFCFMPIVFYVGTKLHADVKDRKHDENDTRLHYESD